jgi:hypothetical protein
VSFPSSRAVAGTNGTTADTTATLDLPSGYQPGDTLFAVFRCAVPGAVTWPSGWTELTDESADAADDQQSMAWRLADGSEGSSITLGANGNGKFAAVIWAIEGAADPNVRPPQLSTVATGSGTEPNATTCTPTGGAKDYGWLTIYGMEGEQTGITSYPSSYADGQQFANSGTGGAVTTNVTVGGAFRKANASSEDAGVWDVTGTLDDWTAYTIVFHPVDDPYVEPVLGTQSVRRHASARQKTVAIAASLLFWFSPPQDNSGPLPAQESATPWTQSAVGVSAWRGLKPWPAFVGGSAGIEPVAEALWTQRIRGTESLGRHVKARAARSALAQLFHLANPAGDVPLLAAEPEAWTQPTQGTWALSRSAAAYARTAAIAAGVRLSGSEFDGPLPPQEALVPWTQDTVGVSAWRGLKPWPAFVGGAAGGADVQVLVDPHQGPVLGTALLSQRAADLWRRGVVSRALRQFGSEFDGPPLEPPSFTQPVVGTASLQRTIRRFQTISVRVRPWLQATCDDGSGTLSGWQSPVFYPAQYQNLAWLLWYRAGGVDGSAPPPPQEGLVPWAQPVQGTSSLLRAAAKYSTSVLRSLSLRVTRTDEPLFPTPEPDTWTQPVLGTSGLRLSAARWLGAFRSLSSHLWRTPQDVNGPLAPQEPATPWTQQVAGTRSHGAALGRFATAATRSSGLRFTRTDEPLVAPPEPDSWPQPASGTFSLRAAHSRRLVAVRASTLQLWTTAQDQDGPLEIQPLTWIQPVSGTRSLARLNQDRQHRVRVPSQQDAGPSIEPDPWTQPVQGWAGLRAGAARWRTAVRAVTPYVWWTPQDVNGPQPPQEAAAPWAQGISGSGALRAHARRYTAAALQSFALRVTRTDDPIVALVLFSADDLRSPVGLGADAVSAPIRFDADDLGAA